MISPPLILRVLRQPDALTSLSLADWDLLLRQARNSNLLAHIYALLEERGLIDKVPPQPREHLESSHIIAEKHTKAVQWEVILIRKALARIGAKIILLPSGATGGKASKRPP